MIEDDSVEGSYDIPMKEEYKEVKPKVTILDKMICFIASREMTTPADLVKEFGSSGHTQRLISNIGDNERVIRKTCPTGRCVWFQLSPKL